MKENLVIRNGQHYDLRINGEWHDHQTSRDAWILLDTADLNADRMLESAITMPAPFSIEYRPSGRHRWWLNGNPAEVKWIRMMLRETGSDKECIDAIVRGHKLAYEVEQMVKCS